MHSINSCIDKTKAKEKLRVCLICSVGGHFKQMLKLADAWRHCEHFYVLMDKPVIDSFRKREKVYLVNKSYSKADFQKISLKRKEMWRWKTGRWRAFRNIPVSWLHQRMRYMDNSEKLFHIGVNTLVCLILFAIFSLFGLFKSWFYRLLISLLSARTINWLINDHFWGLLLVSTPWVKNPGLEKIMSYIEDSRVRTINCKSISVYAIYGGLSKGRFHDQSDIDVRYIRKPGFSNALSSLSFAMRERAIAFFPRIPLDLYVGNSLYFLQKMREDELPIVLKDDEDLMSLKYGFILPGLNDIKLSLRNQ